MGKFIKFSFLSACLSLDLLSSSQGGLFNSEDLLWKLYVETGVFDCVRVFCFPTKKREGGQAAERVKVGRTLRLVSPLSVLAASERLQACCVGHPVRGGVAKTKETQLPSPGGLVKLRRQSRG